MISSDLLLEPGETDQVSILKVSSDGILIKADAKITWSSSDKRVAFVDKNGAVKAKAEGKAIITGKIGTKKYLCKVTVKKLKEVILTDGSVLSLKGKLQTVITEHAGNGEKITCYILRLSTPVKFSIGGYKSKVSEIQLVPEDSKQENEFRKADGTTTKVKGEVITGDTAWYIREFGMIHITFAAVDTLSADAVASADKTDDIEIKTKEETKSDYTNRMIIQAYKGNKLIWTYKTEYVEMTELSSFSKVYDKNNRLYFREYKSIVALDKETGKSIWKAKGCGAGELFFDKKGLIYVPGYYGPDIFCVSINGNVQYIKDRYDEELYWAYDIKIKDDCLYIYYACDNGKEPKISHKVVFNKWGVQEMYITVNKKTGELLK